MLVGFFFSLVASCPINATIYRRSNSDFAGKICVYTDSSGQAVPPPIERTASSSNGSGLLNGVGSSDVNTPSEPRKRKATQPPPAVSDNHSRPANSNYPPPPPPDAAAPPFYHSDPNRSSTGLTRSESHSLFPGGERSPHYPAQQQSGPRVDPAVVHELVNCEWSVP